MIEGAGFRAIGVGGVGDALSAAGRQLNAAAACCLTGLPGGGLWTEAAVYKVLASQVYLGDAIHKGVLGFERVLSEQPMCLG